MSWGKGIILVFIAFAVFIGTLVSICIRQDISLVSKDYYNDELNYQDEIDQMNNTNGLATKPSISIRGNYLTIVFCDLPKLHHCELKLLRPSDPRHDADFQIRSDTDSVWQEDISNFPKGRYNVSLRWQMGGQTFLSQTRVTLQ